jgi:hypothetical protein
MILRFCFRKKEIDCASSSLVKVSRERNDSFLSFDSQLSKSDFLSVYSLLLLSVLPKGPRSFRSPCSSAVSQIHSLTKLSQVSYTLSAFLSGSYFFTNFLFHTWVFPSFCEEDTIKLGLILSSVQFSIFKLFSMISISFKIIPLIVKELCTVLFP